MAVDALAPVKTSARLALLLEAEGFSGAELHPAKGHYRTSKYADVHRWEGFATHGTISVSLYSWDTMTACVKRGIVVSERDQGSSGFGYEVSAKSEEKSTPPLQQRPPWRT